MPARATAKKAASPKKNGFQTPALPKAKPESVGLSSGRLKALSEIIRREVDKGTLPGAVVMVGRKGKVAHFDAIGKQGPSSDAKMRHDSVFRIFLMTKPIVSVAHAAGRGRQDQRSAVEAIRPSPAARRRSPTRNPSQPMKREITIQDLQSHSGISTNHGPGPIQTRYSEAKIYRRSMDNAEHAEVIAKPLICQPGVEWNYSRSTDILAAWSRSSQAKRSRLPHRSHPRAAAMMEAASTSRRSVRTTGSPSRSRPIRGPATRSSTSR